MRKSITFIKKSRLALYSLERVLHIAQPLYKIKKAIIKKQEPQNINYDLLYQKIIKYSPDTCRNALRNSERNNTSLYNLTIIVPAYNVEKYIEDCLLSILKNTSDINYKVHTIIVNDGSKDATLDKINKYVSNNITIINQKNKGAAFSRNRALDVANSDYVMFLDGDDYLDYYSIESLLDLAYSQNADIVEGAYTDISSKGRIEKSHPHISGEMKVCDLYGFPWGKIYRTALFSNVDFPEGVQFEDSVCRQLIYDKALKICGTDKNIYFYRKNKKGLSALAKTNYKAIDSYYITLKLYEERQALGLKNDDNYYIYMLHMIRLNYMRARLLSDDFNQTSFLLFAIFLNNIFLDRLNAPNLSDFEKAISTYNYKKFKLCCDYNIGF